MLASIAAAAHHQPLAATIHWQALGPLVLASAALMGSPGPATVSTAAVVSAYGTRRSLAYLLGVIAGTIVVLVAVATGVTAALLAVPGMRPVLIAVSAAYIVWLAYHIATAPPLAARASDAAPSAAGAVVVAVANPKAWFAIAAVFAGARLADGAVLDAIAKTAVLSAMIAVIMGSWFVAGASLASLLRDPRRARAVNATLAVVLVATTLLAVLR